MAAPYSTFELKSLSQMRISGSFSLMQSLQLVQDVKFNPAVNGKTKSNDF